MIITPKNILVWFFLQVLMLTLVMLVTIGLTILVTGLMLGVFGIGHIARQAWFLPSVAAAVVIAFIALRREYMLTNRFEFTADAITVRTIFGVERTYAMQDFAFEPVLNKAIGIPQRRAHLSFAVNRRSDGKSVRNFSWLGFPRDDFARVSRFYGYSGDTDFNLWTMGR